MKIAIIGAHWMETRALYDNLCKRFSVTEVVACTDPDLNSAVAMGANYGVKAVPLEDILASKEITLVLNATFPEHTEEYTEKCLLAGKSVITSRQIANTFETGKRFFQIAKEKNVKLGCCPDAFFGAGIQTARYLLDHDALGKVHSASAVLVRDNPQIAEIMPHIMQYRGGILYDMSGYYLMPMFCLFGAVKKVSAFGAKAPGPHYLKKHDSPMKGLRLDPVEYNVLSIVLEFEDNVLVTLHLNSGSIFQKDIFEIAGDNGVMNIGYPHEFNAPVSLTVFNDPKTEIPHRFGFSEPVFGVGVADMAWALQNGRTPRLNKELALHDLEVLHGIETSIETGRPYLMSTSIKKPEPLTEGCYGTSFIGYGEETSLAV